MEWRYKTNHEWDTPSTKNCPTKWYHPKKSYKKSTIHINVQFHVYMQWTGKCRTMVNYNGYTSQRNAQLIFMNINLEWTWGKQRNPSLHVTTVETSNSFQTSKPPNFLVSCWNIHIQAYYVIDGKGFSRLSWLSIRTVKSSSMILMHGVPTVQTISLFVCL